MNKVGFGFATRSKGAIVICGELEAGHTYETRPVERGGRFFPLMTDVTTHKIVDPRCRNGRPRALAVQPAAPTLAAAPPGPPTTPPPATEATDGADAPPPPPRPAVDTEEPSLETPPPLDAPMTIGRAPIEKLPSDAVLANRPPGSGLSLFFGAGFGGTDFVRATSSNGDSQTLSSGSGVILGVGLILTPIWVAETLGFGVGADVSVKYDQLSAENGTASITRYPIALTAHVLVNVSGGGNHFIILRGGAIRDFGVNYSTSGFATIDANVTGTWGPTGSFGYYKRSNDMYGWELVGYFALTNHDIGTERINANSFGALAAMHFTPF
jgi:hypothetical protein